jgi:hypothetical protein
METGHITFYPKPTPYLLNDFYSNYKRSVIEPTVETEYTPEIVKISAGVLNHLNSVHKKEKWTLFDYLN